MRTRLIPALIALPLALAACGGGGTTSSSPMPAAPGASSVGALSDGMATATAIARGTVVDAESGAPLAGVTVSLSPYIVGAAPMARTSTDGAGNFAVGARTADWYLLTVGSESPADNVRPTLHLRVRMTTGTTVVQGPSPYTYNDIHYTAPQTAGAVRLTTLTANEKDCLAGAQQGRAMLKLPPVIVDELLLEDARAVLQEIFAQDTDTPTPLYPSASQPHFLFDGLEAVMHTEEGFPTCSSWSGPQYSYVPSDPYQGAHPPYPQASDPKMIYYGTAFELAGSRKVSSASYGAQLYAVDPRT